MTENIDTRSEAEAFESHYIALYDTGKYFNKAKVGYGINKYLPNRENEWEEYIPYSELQKELVDKRAEKQRLASSVQELEKEIIEEKTQLSELQKQLDEYKNKRIWNSQILDEYIIENDIVCKCKNAYGFDLDDVLLFYYLTQDESVEFESVWYDYIGRPATCKKSCL